ncbi:hypothetical protein P3T76_013556 [Phytophthora citrophthora]|uniref:Uncharacterized protein n=1 Tax=Phytophthora citrophthora TaxID=4793 RepID=A0AAD9LCY8_9STRA|nr:hypothetical protein P3T76_013556 [Phytophthora citrophthora]
MTRLEEVHLAAGEARKYQTAAGTVSGSPKNKKRRKKSHHELVEADNDMDDENMRFLRLCTCFDY